MPITPSPKFLDAFAEQKGYYLSLPFLWSVQFSNAGQLNGAITKACGKIATQGSPWTAKGNIEQNHLLAARQVTIPPEQSMFFEAGQNNRGGFMPGFGLQQRESFLTRTLAINFIETIDDIVHNLFTPWGIAIGVDGMINFGLRADITVQQYDNKGNPRKGYKFVQAFPTNVEGFTVTQDPDAPFTEKTVTFSFKDYVPAGNAYDSPGYSDESGNPLS